MAVKPLQSITFPELDNKYTIPVVDNTLTTAGAAADAKKVGDELTSVKQDLSDISGQEKISFTDGYYMQCNKTTVDINNPIATQYGYAYAVVDCTEGDVFTVNASGGDAPRAWCFIDENGTVLKVSYKSMDVRNEILVAPSGAAKLIINDKSGLVSYRGVPFSNEIKLHDKQLKNGLLIAYKEDFSNLLISNVFTAYHDDTSVTIYRSKNGNGAILFGTEGFGLIPGEEYVVSFDYDNQTNSNMALRFVEKYATSDDILGYERFYLPANTKEHYESEPITWQGYYKYFRILLYVDAGTSLVISNLKIERISKAIEGAFETLMDKKYGQHVTYINPVLVESETQFCDPTLIRGSDGIFYAYSTGKKINAWESNNLIDWEYVGSIIDDDDFATLSALINPNTPDNIYSWAPCVIKHDNKYVMYVTMVDAGNTYVNSRIVAFTSYELQGPWKLHGQIISAASIGVYDCIDPCVIGNSAGELFMMFGSKNGIYLIKLSRDGLSIDTDFEKALIHPHSGSNNNTKLEGAYLYYRRGYYYLFTSCGDYAKTGNYHVTVSRSQSLTGPFVDKDGNSIASEENVGESIIIGTARLLSPGHISEIIRDNKGRYFIMLHAYRKSDTIRSGCIVEVFWDEYGWPYVHQDAYIPSNGYAPVI